MRMNVNNIFKQGKAVLLCAIAASLFMCSFSVPNAWADPIKCQQKGCAERKGKYCIADDKIPDLTKTAHCKKDNCDTKPGCLDPAPVANARRFSSVPGKRNVSVGSSNHKGNDIVAPLMAPVYAGGDGKVLLTDMWNYKGGNGYGNYFVIQHKNKVTIYGHFHCFAERVKADGTRHRFKNGETIKKGQLIGFVGSTGGSSGTHLHYEIRDQWAQPRGTAYNATLDGNAQSGLLCEIPKDFVQSGTQQVQDAAGGGGANGSSCSGSGCAKMYPANNISELHHKYESGGNACAYNKCVAGDPGGCSYGSSQLACKSNSMLSYLKQLQATNKAIWNALGGGSVDAMNKRACAPDAGFVNKWKSMCSGSLAAQFSQSQEKYMQATYYDSGAKAALNNYGIDFNSRSPELQMALYSAAVALGSPGGVNNLLKSVKNNIGDPAAMSDAELLQAMYARRDHFYGSSSPSIRASVQRRNANEGTEALESLKIREAWEKAQRETPNKTYAEVVKEVTGKEPCAAGKSGTFNCEAGALGMGQMGGSSGYSEDGTEPDRNCAPSNYAASMTSCLFCPLFKVIFDTASLMAKLTFDKLAIPVMSVVLVAWAIWIAMTILKYVSALDTKDVPSMVKELLSKSLVVLVVVVFLQADSGTFFQMALEPIFNTGFKLAQLALADGTCKEDFGVLKDGGLPASMGNSILCTIKAIQDRLINTMSLGSASMCVGWYIKGKLFIFGSIPYLISGLLIWGGCLVLLVIYPFLMLDSIFQLTVACALLPAAIGCYPFKLTKRYVGKVWNAFINAMFNFIFLCIMILIFSAAIDETLKTSLENTVGADASDMDNTYMEVILNALVWAGITLMKIVFILLLAWAVLDEVSDFANDFAGGLANGDIGRQIGGLAATGTKKLSGKAWSGAKAVGKTVGENVKESVQDWNRDRKMNNIARNGTEEEIRDASGNVIGKKYVSTSKSWFRGRDKTNEVTVAANGTRVLTSTKDYGNGKIVTTKSDGYIKQTETTVDGKVTGSSVSITTAGLKSIRNKDGTMNTTALNAAIRGSAFDEKTVRAAAMMEYAKKSFQGNIAHFKTPLDKMDISLTTNEDGQEVLQMVEKAENGSSKTMRMTMGNGSSRGLLEVETVSSDGKVENYATDGMFNRRFTAEKNSDTGELENKQAEYSVSDYYAKQTKYPVDDQGRFAEVFTEGVPTAFSSEDQENMLGQFIDDRVKNENNSIDGIV